MQAAFDCPAYGSEPADFNILKPARRAESGASRNNYQAHQPPLYYLAAASLLELFAPGIGRAPESQILLLRLAAVLVVGYVLCFPLRKLGRGNMPLEALVLLAMLLPGAAESLVRVSNDVGVFAWAIYLLSFLARSERFRPSTLALMAAIGPLLKLTALPIVGFAAACQWRARGWRAGGLMSAAGLIVFPLQWLRGWAWGGTLEANVTLCEIGSFSEILRGLVHSVVTFIKTAVWLGGWSFFRPPAWILVALPLLAIVILYRCLHWRANPQNVGAHLIGITLASLGFVAFALGQRQIFGVWGGVGVWYLWAWAPWLALLASDLLAVRCGRERELAFGALVAAAILNVAWFAVAVGAYGG